MRAALIARTVLILGCLAGAGTLYWGGKEGGGWFIFFAVMIWLCSEDE